MIRALPSDLRYEFRSLRRRPGFSATIILTLALGLGLGAGVFSFADGYLFRPLPFPSPDQLYRVRDPHAKIALLAVDTIALRQGAAGEFGFVEWSPGDRVSGELTLADRRVPVFSYEVSPGFGQTLRLPLVAGRFFADADHRDGGPVPVWLSHRFWQRELGGDPGVLNRTFRVDGPRPMDIIVAGILAPEVASFDLNNEPPDLIAPALPDVIPPQRRDMALSFPIVRLPDGMTRAQGEARISAALQAVSPAADGRPREIQLRPLRDAQVAGGAPTARVLLAGALLILLLVTVNLVHLLLAQGVARAREVATRAALGASRGQVMRLFLIEGLVLGAAGIAGGLVLGAWMSHLIASRVPLYPTAGRNLALVPVVFDQRVVVVVIAIGLVVAIVSGIWPAWRAVRRPLHAGMRTEGGAASGLPTRLSRGVLASELAVATVLLLGTVFIGLGIWRYLHRPLGYSYEDRVVIAVSPTGDGRYDGDSVDWMSLKTTIGTIDGVQAVGAYRFSRGQPIAIDGEAVRNASAVAVTEGFFDAWQVRLSAGRWFTLDEYRGEASVAIVDAAFARRVWADNAIGQDLDVSGVPHRVIGVVETQVRSLRTEPTGEAYVPRRAPPAWVSLVAWAPGLSAADLEQRLTPALRQTMPAARLSVEPVTRMWLFNRQTGEAEFQGPIMTAFALLTFTLAGIGIFGLVSYLVAQRTREFGIRLALGASRRDIWRFVIRDSLTPAIAGLVVGIAAARLLERFVVSTAFGWESSGAVAVTVVSAAVLAVAVIAAAAPARRALRIDPAIVLRTE